MISRLLLKVDLTGFSRINNAILMLNEAVYLTLLRPVIILLLSTSVRAKYVRTPVSMTALKNTTILMALVFHEILVAVGAVTCDVLRCL